MYSSQHYRAVSYVHTLLIMMFLLLHMGRYLSIFSKLEDRWIVILNDLRRRGLSWRSFVPMWMCRMLNNLRSKIWEVKSLAKVRVIAKPLVV